jgi:hypothetical protein
VQALLDVAVAYMLQGGLLFSRHWQLLYEALWFQSLA